MHGAITFIFLSCIGYIYYSAFVNRTDTLTYIAVGMILFEMAVIVINKGNCPLGVIHNKFGDDKTFFELFLSKPMAKRAVPVLGAVAAIGILLLFV